MILSCGLMSAIQCHEGERYEGEYRKGQKHGTGTWVSARPMYASGARYAGEWQAGKKHGRGCYTRADGSVYHDGQWLDDKKA